MEPGACGAHLFSGYQSAGSTDPDVANPFHIGGLAPLPTVGTWVEKVGVSTGWTGGPVEKTCSNLSGGSGIIILCQDFVDAMANNGDSGSPAFTSSGMPTLYGTVCAKTRSDKSTGTI